MRATISPEPSRAEQRSAYHSTGAHARLTLKTHAQLVTAPPRVDRVHTGTATKDQEVF